MCIIPEIETRFSEDLQPDEAFAAAAGVLPALPPLEITDEEFIPPETDLTPHINVGSSFQADIDDWWIANPTEEELDEIPEKADLVFHPSTSDHITPEQMRLYLKFACSAAVDGGGRNKELAHHLLQQKNGSISDCVLTLMERGAIEKALGEMRELESYTYVDTSVWSQEEMQKFQAALFQHEKFFTEISKEMGNRTVKECVNFYYTWKKVCTEDYRKLKRKRRADLIQRQQQNAVGTAVPEVGNYNLRSQNQPPEPSVASEQRSSSPKNDTTSTSSNVNILTVDEPRSVKSEVSGMGEREEAGSGMSGREMSEERSLMASRSEYDSDRATPSEPARKKAKVKHTTRVPGGIPDENGEFPCRLCGKVFTKVKSRNAHMKSHAMKGER